MDVEYEAYSYRHAEEILNSRMQIFRQIKDAVHSVVEAQVSKDEGNLTAQLMNSFKKLGWEDEVLVADNQSHEQFFDLFKERVAVEIEFSRYEFLYRDYLRFLSAYNADKIDVGVLITHAESGLSRVKGKSYAPSLTRVTDDLLWLRPVVTVPIWVVALK